LAALHKFVICKHKYPFLAKDIAVSLSTPQRTADISIYTEYCSNYEIQAFFCNIKKFGRRFDFHCKPPPQYLQHALTAVGPPPPHILAKYGIHLTISLAVLYYVCGEIDEPPKNIDK
jgi:hypothetical protein